MTDRHPTPAPRVIGPNDGEISGEPESRTDRFMLDGKDSSGHESLVEHTVAPHVLAGPLHRHSREDEYSYVLEGRLAALLGDELVIAEQGDLVYRPKGRWHMFWNPGDVPTRILEIIAPAGLEELSASSGARAASTTRRHFPPSRPATDARSTSRPPSPSCNSTG